MEERVQRKKFTIQKSDEPGDYELVELRESLIQYLSQDLVTANRINTVLLPACLKYTDVKRDLLKSELVKAGEADDLNSAGYGLSVISGQMSLKKNDFLRQAIGYEYPNNPWEKDNYFIRDGYKDLIREVLVELGVEN